MTKTLITGAYIVPMTGSAAQGVEYYRGSVAIEGNRIAIVAREGDPEGKRRIAEWRGGAGELREIDGRGKMVTPGLINTHTHVAMTLMRNMADDVPLMAWLNERVWPFENHLGAQEIAVGARLGMAEMLLGGTTTLVDMYWHEAAIGREASDVGIRAVLCPSFVDGERMAMFEEDLIDTLAVAARCERLSVRIAPHAAYSCSAENLRRAVELARQYGIGLHTHLSETLDEQRIVRERTGLTPTGYLNGLGFFDVPVIAAHCVHVTEGDIDILRDHGVTAVHNPQSNMKLASGAAPLARMVARGLNVAIGTDGASSNNDLDMWDEMRSASLLGKLTAGDPEVLPAHQVLQMATVGGARAIGMEGELGVVAPGALADLVVIDIEKPHFYPRGDLIAGLVYGAKSSDVDTVFVDGRMVVSGGHVVGLDLEGAMHEVQKTADAIKRKL